MCALGVGLLGGAVALGVISFGVGVGELAGAELAGAFSALSAFHFFGRALVIVGAGFFGGQGLITGNCPPTCGQCVVMAPV